MKPKYSTSVVSKIQPLLWNVENDINEKPGDYVRKLTEEIISDGNNDVLYYNRALTYCEMESYELSIEDFSKAIRLNGKEADYWCHRGLAYFSLKQYVPAMKDLNKAIELNPVGKYFNDRAIVNQIMENYDLALKDYNVAVEKNKCCAEFRHNRALLYKIMGNYRQSMVDLNRSIFLDENNIAAYNSRAIVYLHLGQPLKALEDLNYVIEEVLDINPYVYNNRGLVNIHLGRYQKAVKDLNVAAAFLKDSSVFFKRGVSHLKLGNLTKAREDFEKVVELDSTVYCTLKKNFLAKFEGGVEYYMKILKNMEEKMFVEKIEAIDLSTNGKTETMRDEDEDEGETEEISILQELEGHGCKTMSDEEVGETEDFFMVDRKRKRDNNDTIEDFAGSKRRKKLEDGL